MKKTKKRLFIHTLLENPAIKRMLSFYVSLRTLDIMLQSNGKPIARIANIITSALREHYEEYNKISHNELEKKLYEVAEQ